MNWHRRSKTKKKGLINVKVGFEGLQAPLIRFLSNDQLYEIHLATLEILDRVGVRVDEPEARELLKNAGAWVNEENNICRIPPHLVDDAIKSSPPRIVLSNRENKRCMFLEKNQPYFGTGSDLPFTLDPYTGERGNTTKKDIENTSRVTDALPNIDFMMSMGIATDTSELVSDLHQFEAMVNNCRKPMIVTAHHRQGLLDIIEMASLIRGGLENLQANPLFVTYVEPISPLRHAFDSAQKLLTCAEYLIPINYTPGMLAGATAPVTRAGAIATANAELLSGLTIHQLKRRGAPFVFGGAVTILDMKTTQLSYAAPEFHVNNIILTQLSQMYELPMFSTAGCSDSPVFDEQAALETAYTLLLAGLSGANLIHDVGFVESGLTCSLEMLVVSDEMIDMVRFMLRNFLINEETLALDVIEKVGPGKEFVTEGHTFKNFRKELWFPKLISRERRKTWEDGGKLTLAQRANKKAIEILENHQVPLLPEYVREGMRELISRREREYAKKKGVQTQK